MNFQEHAQLTTFLQQLTQAQPSQKDPEAEVLIRAACSRQPDASYLLVQRTLLLEQALQDAKEQIRKLQEEISSLRNQSPAASPSFLGKGWNSTPPANVSLATGGTPIPQPSAPVANPSAGGSGFLQNMATTAAGVVAGSFLFQGIESMMGHHGGGWGGSNNAPSSGLTENTVVNNHISDTPSDDLADLAAFDDGASSDWI